MREDLFAIASLVLLCVGVLLNLGNLVLPAIDVIIPLFFAGAISVGLVSRRHSGQASAALGLAALLLHVGILFLA